MPTIVRQAYDAHGNPDGTITVHVTRVKSSQPMPAWVGLLVFLVAIALGYALVRGLLYYATIHPY